MQFIINGITGFNNRGVEAFTVPTVECLLKIDPSANVIIHSVVPKPDIGILPQPQVSVREDSLARRVGRLATRTPMVKPLVRRWIPSVLTCQKEIKASDAVIALGGDIFSSDYGASNKHLFPMQYAQEHGVKTVFLGHSVGPYRNENEAETFCKIAKKANLVTVRESMTYRYLVEELKFSEDQVHLAADPAFLLQPPPQEIRNAMLEAFGIHRDRPLIALAISGRISKFRNLSSQQHLETWAKVVKHLLAKDLEVMIIPHTQDADLRMATELLRHLKYPAHAHMIGAMCSASEFKGVIGCADMLVSERMHACIAGLGSGVCTLPVAYSVKYPGITADLTGLDVEKEKMVIDIHDFLTDNQAIEAIDRTWNRRTEIDAVLAERLPAYRELAATNYSLLESCIKN